MPSSFSPGAHMAVVSSLSAAVTTMVPAGSCTAAAPAAASIARCRAAVSSLTPSARTPKSTART
jgi:hypothetical protein